MSFDQQQTFSYSGSSVIWNKPVNVTNVSFELFGGGGGGSTSAGGGGGAYINAQYNNLIADISYNVIINVGQGGQAPPSSAGGRSWGGDPTKISNGGSGTTNALLSSGGGGGMSSVLYIDGSGNNIIKIVAGGGGGGGVVGAGILTGGASGNIGLPLPGSNQTIFTSSGSNGIGAGAGGGGNANLIGDAGLGGSDGGANGNYYIDSSGTYLFQGGGGGNGGIVTSGSSVGCGGAGGAGFGGGGGGGSGGGGGGGCICQNSNLNYFLLGGGGSGGSSMQAGQNGQIIVRWNVTTPILPDVIVREFMLDSQHSCRSIYSAPTLKPAGVVSNSTQFASGSTSNLNSAVIDTNSNIYVVGGNGLLYAFDQNLNRKWSLAITTPNNYAFFGTPVVTSTGTLYVSSTTAATTPSQPGILWAIVDNTTAGGLKWQNGFSTSPSDGNITTSPTVDLCGNIFFGTESGAIYAITDATINGTQIWRYSLNNNDPFIGAPSGPVTGALAFNTNYKQLCYTTQYNGDYSYLVALDVSSNSFLNAGRPPIRRWYNSIIGSESYNVPSIGITSSTIQTVFVTTNIYATSGEAISGKVYAYDISNNIDNGNPLWSIPISDIYLSNIAISNDNHIYFTSQNAFYSINTSSQQLEWLYSISITQGSPSNINSTPIIDLSNNVLFGSRNNSLYSLHPVTHSYNWRYSPPLPNGIANSAIEAMPVIGKYGNIYVAGYGGVFYDFCGNSVAPLPTQTVPMYMLNTKHTGLSPYYGPNLSPPPTVDFSASFISGNLYVSPSIAVTNSGTFYIGTNDGIINAYNPTLTPVFPWPHNVSSSPLYTTPVIALDGTIYVGSFDGYLYAINPDGSDKWQWPTTPSPLSSGIAPLQSSPIIDSAGILYFGAGNNVYAIGDDGVTFYNKWTTISFSTQARVNSSPALGSNGYLYFGSDDGKVYAVNSLNGTLIWSFDASGNTGGIHPIYTSASVDASDNVVIGTGSYMNGVLYYLNSATGQPIWSKSAIDWSNNDIIYNSNIGPFYNTVAIYRDTFYLSTIPYVYAINRVTGQSRWKYINSNCYYTSATIDASGTLFFCSIKAKDDPDKGLKANDGLLHCVTDNGNTTFLENWSVKVSSPGRLAPPVIGQNKTIYVSSTANQVYVLK